jgi:hypothetical protein
VTLVTPHRGIADAADHQSCTRIAILHRCIAASPDGPLHASLHRVHRIKAPLHR